MASGSTWRQKSTTSALPVEYTPGTTQWEPAQQNSPEKGSGTPGRSRLCSSQKLAWLVTFHAPARSFMASPPFPHPTPSGVESQQKSPGSSRGFACMFFTDWRPGLPLCG